MALMPQTAGRASWSDTDSDSYFDTWTDPATSVSTTLADMNAAGTDADSDGATNDEEAAEGSDPYTFDSDQDGIGDGDELHLVRQSMWTSLTNWDSNGDYVSDYDHFHNFFGVTYQGGSLPIFPNTTYYDYDGDGANNPVDPFPTDPNNGDGDLDGDSIANGVDPAPLDYPNTSPHNSMSWYEVALSDADADGLLNFYDVWPEDSSNGSPDRDGDGLDNWNDPAPLNFENYSFTNRIYWFGGATADADGDNTANYQDLWPFDPYNGANAASDADEDGIPDSIDPGPQDGTNLSTTNNTTWYHAVFEDLDQDGIANFDDALPYDTYNGLADFDGDGLLNGNDPYPKDALNTSPLNSIAWQANALNDDDSDGQPNWRDPGPSDPNDIPPDYSGLPPSGDLDGDGLANAVDPAPGYSTNFSPYNAKDWYGLALHDDDGDGLDNWHDPQPHEGGNIDQDGDLILNHTDPFPTDPENFSAINNTAWESQVYGDLDSDGIFNYQDSTPFSVDVDEDGLTANQEALYGTSDEDVDCDDDSLTDYEELIIHETDPLNAYSISIATGWGELYTDDLLVDDTDSDEDVIPDLIEEHYGLDSEDPADASGDLDSNGLTNLTQYQMGIALNADLDRYDADGDGMTDIFENYYLLSRLNPNDAVADNDGDGVINYEEQKLVLSPLEADTLSRGGIGDMLVVMEAFLYPEGGAPTADANENGTPDWADTALTVSTNPVFTREESTDLDGDAMPDVWEHKFGRWKYPSLGLYLRFDDADDDADEDDLINQQEYKLGTNPVIGDTDDDGIDDGDEDEDGDGLGAAEEYANGTGVSVWDSDGDGIPDGQEIEEGTDPLDAENNSRIVGLKVYTRLN